MAGGGFIQETATRRLFLRGRLFLRRGFTLMEVVIGTFLIAVGLVALMSAFFSGLLLVESSRGMSVASADARAVFEEMRRVSAGGLAAVTATNWTTWSRAAGLTTLSNESVAVSFRNRNADPLETTVTVSWSEKNRNRSMQFTGLVTRR